LPDDKKRVLEKYYSSNIEGDYPNIYDFLLDSSAKKVDNKMRIKILSFVFSQFTRTSKLTNTFNDFWNRGLERGYQMMNPDSVDQKIYFEGGGSIDFKDKTLEQVQKESDNQSRQHINLKNFERFYDLRTRRLKDIINIYKVHSDDLLVTSDNPVISSCFMFDPKSHFHMPLDEKHMILLLPFQQDTLDIKEVHRTNLGKEMSYVQSITNNIRQIENAERYVIGSRTALDKAVYDMKNLNIDDLEGRSKKVIENLNKTSALIQQIFNRS
jgi:hypothetical protein